MAVDEHSHGHHHTPAPFTVGSRLATGLLEIIEMRTLKARFDRAVE
jgi:hypothetical protein